MNEQNKSGFKTFVKEYWGCLLLFVLALCMFAYCLRGELQAHLVYRQAQEHGDLLAMGEMRVNGNGEIRQDHTISLPTGSTMCGPYFDYEAGSYVLSVTLHAEEAVTDQTISVTASGGTEQIGTYLLQEGPNLIQVDLEKDVKQLEIVLRNEGTGELEVQELTFESGFVPGWEEQQEPEVEQSSTEIEGIDLLSDMKWTENANLENGILTLYKGDYIYGPYLDLEAGEYVIVLDCDYDQKMGELTAQVTAENGEIILATQTVQPGENPIRFSVDDDIKGMEIVLRNEIFDKICIYTIMLNQVK